MPKQYGNFEQSFAIAPRYFMLRYKLCDDFAEKKVQYEEEHNASVKKRLED